MLLLIVPLLHTLSKGDHQTQDNDIVVEKAILMMDVNSILKAVIGMYDWMLLFGFNN